jgi:hypothetical protein
MNDLSGEQSFSSAPSPAVKKNARRDTADFNGFDSLLNDLSGDQSILSEFPAEDQSVVDVGSPVISPITAAAMRALEHSKAVMSGKKSSKKTAKAESSSKKNRRNSTGSVDTAMAGSHSPEADTPLRTSHLASPSSRRSPRFASESDLTVSVGDNTFSSNGSSLFAGFGRRDTVNAEDMQDVLNDLSADDFTMSPAPVRMSDFSALPEESGLNQSTMSAVSGLTCDNTMNTLQMRDNMSALLGQSTTSNAPSMDLLYSSASSISPSISEEVQQTLNQEEAPSALNMSVMSDLSTTSSVKVKKTKDSKNSRKSLSTKDKRRQTVDSGGLLLQFI